VANPPYNRNNICCYENLLVRLRSHWGEMSNVRESIDQPCISTLQGFRTKVVLLYPSQPSPLRKNFLVYCFRKLDVYLKMLQVTY